MYAVNLSRNKSSPHMMRASVDIADVVANIEYHGCNQIVNNYFMCGAEKLRGNVQPRLFYQKHSTIFSTERKEEKTVFAFEGEPLRPINKFRRSYPESEDFSLTAEKEGKKLHLSPNLSALLYCRKVKYYRTSKYVFVLPASEDDKYAYSIAYNHATLILPEEIMDLGIPDGERSCFVWGCGFAFPFKSASVVKPQRNNPKASERKKVCRK